MSFWYYALAASIGGLVGLGELIFRYRDAPAALFRRSASWAYVGFNAAAATAALAFIVAFGWRFGQTDEDSLRVTRVLVAGFGSVALFRTNLFVVKAGDENIGAGPSLLLASLLGATDRAVDRYQARKRAEDVSPIMADVSFELASQALVSFALTATVSVPPQAKEDLKTGVAALESADFPDQTKSMILGLMLIDVVGLDVLRQSVEALGESIEGGAEVTWVEFVGTENDDDLAQEEGLEDVDPDDDVGADHSE